ncbi:MAG: AAA family ATPase [bacterium]
MLNRIEIWNFKCLREVDVKLSPLTVLVGPNGSGKSTVLQALDLVVQRPDQMTWQHDLSKTVRVQAEMSDGKKTGWSYQNERKPSFQKAEPTYAYQFLRLDLNGLRKLNQVREERKLYPDGSNLTNLIDSLTRKEQERLAQDLCQAVPLFQDVDVRPAPGSPGNHQLYFQDRWNSELWYRPDEVSDGTMLTLAFMALQYQSPIPDILAIEEPERGLHPYLLGALVKLLRGMSQGAFGDHAVQVVMATHSAELLDHLEPDEVRFMRRSPKDGSAIIEPARTDSDEWRQTYEEYQESLGSIWLSGGLGGVPARPGAAVGGCAG